MTRVGRVFQSEPQHVRIYLQPYDMVNCRMYRRLQPLHREIRDRRLSRRGGVNAARGCSPAEAAGHWQ